MDPLQVTLKSGSLQGKKATNYKGGELYSFQGIPYAKPPVGDLRFKPPVPADPWQGVLDATKCGASCIQRDFFTPKVIGTEDCLYLNVYTKSTSQKDLKPVMVWIHGGAFTLGSADDSFYSPDYLLVEDIVLVTINYRLGLLGFLSLDDPSLGVTGNMGLKDQVLALKWVQENIKNFGGDSNNVTIFGESAGGCAVHYLVLSPLAKGLFHKAIIQSGVALNVWAQCQPLNKEGWTAMGIQESDPKKVLENLKSLSPEEIYEIQKLLKDDLFGSTKRYLGPVVESPHAEQPFITSDPLEIIKSGNYNQVPLIFGFTSEEGLVIYSLEAMGFADKEKMLNNVSLSVPYFLNYPRNSPQFKQVEKKLSQFYYENKNNKEEKEAALFKLISDSVFIVGIKSAIKHHLRTAEQPVYQYKFSLEIEQFAFGKKMFGITAPGASHADDLGVLFKSIIAPEVKDGSEADLAIQKMVRMWTNFAKTGNPTSTLDELLKVKWNPVDPKQEDSEYLNIGTEFKMETEPDDWKNRLKLWKNIFDEQPDLNGFL